MQVGCIVKDFRTHRLFRVTATLLAALTVASSAPMTWAASHREAPMIALDPAADNTDVIAVEVLW